MMLQLRIKLLEKNITMSELAQQVDLSTSAVYRKIHGKSDFTRQELTKLKNILQLTDQEFLNIFFN